MKEEILEAKKKKDECDKINNLIQSKKDNDNHEISNSSSKRDNIDINKRVPKGENINLEKDFKFIFEIKASKVSKEINIFTDLNNNFKKGEEEVITNLLQKKRIVSNLDRLFTKSEQDIAREQELIHQENKTENIDIEQFNVDDPWIEKNYIVRIKDKELKNGEYFNKKAMILHLINEYLAEIELLENKNKIRIDQQMLEPIIPAINSNVVILCGIYKGKIGKLTELNIKSKYAKVDINEKTHYISLGGICKIQ